jgi:hypothetical protein
MIKTVKGAEDIVDQFLFVVLQVDGGDFSNKGVIASEYLYR